jgi:hypothetical protein
MSETTTMPFQPGTVLDAPEAPALDEPSSNNNNLLIILGALAGLAVLAIAAYFLLFSGSDAKTPVAAGAAPSTVTQPSTAASTAPKPVTVPKISKRNFGTDPFKPLIATAIVVAPTTTTTTTTSSTTDSGGTTPTPAPTTVPVGTTYKLRVLDVAAQNGSALVSVNGTQVKVVPGQTFGGDKFKALRFSGGSCGTFKFGDEAFDLCEGNSKKF